MKTAIDNVERQGDCTPASGGFHGAAPRPAASVSPGALLETQGPGPAADLLNPKLGLGRESSWGF